MRAEGDGEMADQLRFGFIGAGEIAVRTAEAVRAAGNARLVAVYDANPDLARDLAAQHGAEAVESADDLVARKDVDAVYIAVPHYLHALMAQKAARAGKHVLLEKPTGTSPEEAERALEAARQCGVTFSVPFVLRYEPAWQRARDLVADGALGRLQFLRIVYTARKPDRYWQGGYTGRAPSDWRTKLLQAGGGVLIMNCIHELDAMRWVTGLEAERVFAEYGTFATPAEVEDAIAVVIRYEGGVIGTVEAGSHVPGEAGPRGNGGHRIVGVDGQLVLEDGRLWFFTERGAAGAPAGAWTEIPVPKADARRDLVADYARALLAGAPPPVPEDAALHAMRIVGAAYRSRDAGRAIPIEEVGRKVVMAVRPLN
jgi:UDP-N-acetyl-2-amino-2-deoxyglucuronate dehydrogenase